MLILEFDDFHHLKPENCLETLTALIVAIPHIKISMFTVPLLRNASVGSNSIWCNRVKEFIDNGNLSLCLHGLTHDHLEFENLSRKEANTRIKRGLDLFDKAGLPCEKVFRGPNWGLNPQTVNALLDNNFTHLYNHKDHMWASALEMPMKVIYYNWNLKRNAPVTDGQIVAHGHTHNVCKNGIDQVLHKIKAYEKQFSPKYFFCHEAS